MRPAPKWSAPRSSAAAATVAALAGLVAAPGSLGQPADPAPRRTLGGGWVAAGPGPAIEGQVEGILDGEVVGAIHTVVAHPTDPDILWVGAVNGGIWKTTSATAASPSWTHRTDFADSLSIGALALDPTDGSHQTLMAGIGRFSSFGRRGGALNGLLRTTDGGATWTPITGGGDLVDKNVSGVAPRGNVLVVSVNNTPIHPILDNVGIFRSTDGGATFQRVSLGDGSITGLPAGICHDLASDPTDDALLFTGVVRADQVGGVNGIYRSSDTGATWTRVSNPAMEALLDSNLTGNIEIAIGQHDNLYVAIVNSGRLAGVFRSGDGGDTFVQMDLPMLSDGGIHPGGQGSTHLSIVADPGDADLVYIGGDRQDFPNAIGATDFTGRLFRGDASQPAGNQWVHLTHSSSLGPPGGGTASGSAPHADSREMTFTADGVLIETDDGGVYKRTSPQTDTGDWFSLNGDIQTTEFHASAWDSNADVAIGGAQDTGTTQQPVPASVTWRTVSSGDGGQARVDDLTTPGLSTRYSSAQRLLGFSRRVYDSSNVLQSITFPSLTVLGGGNALQPQFYTPLMLNAAEPVRLIVGGFNSVYESLDQGDTITEIGPGLWIRGVGRPPIAYGAPGNVDLLYVGVGFGVYVRMGPHPQPLTEAESYPGLSVDGLVLDPDDPATLFVVDGRAVYRTPDSGQSWAPVTGDLLSFSPGEIRAVAYLPTPVGDALLVGADRGVFAALESDGFLAWAQLGTGLPEAPVLDLEYDAADDLVLAGLLGRGAWLLTDASSQATGHIFGDGFETGDTSAWSLAVP